MGIPEYKVPGIITQFFNLSRHGSFPVIVYDLSYTDRISLINQFMDFATPKTFKKIDNILITSLLMEVFCMKGLRQQTEVDHSYSYGNFFDFLDTQAPATEWERMIAAINQFQYKTVESASPATFDNKGIFNRWAIVCENLSDEYTEHPLDIKEKTRIWESFLTKSQINKINPGSSVLPPKI